MALSLYRTHTWPCLGLYFSIDMTVRQQFIDCNFLPEIHTSAWNLVHA